MLNVDFYEIDLFRSSKSAVQTVTQYFDGYKISIASPKEKNLYPSSTAVL